MALHPRRALLLGFTTLCVAAAGCGDDGPSDKDAIADAVKAATASKKIADQCEKGVSDRFVSEVYGNLAHCRKASKPDPKDGPATAKISNTRIEDDKATTALDYRSGSGSRAEGRIALVKDGDTWKVDRLGLDFHRSVIETFASSGTTASNKRSGQCFERKTRALSNSALRKVGNTLVGERTNDLPPALAECLIGGPSVSFAREQFEKGIAQGLREDGAASRSRLSCVNKRLRLSITDAEIERLANDGKLTSKVQRKVTRVLSQC